MKHPNRTFDYSALKGKVSRVAEAGIIPNIDTYNNLIQECVNIFEMRAVVYLYDSMRLNNIQPTEETFDLISKLHSKTIKENDTLLPFPKDNNCLEPRRRIHKIIKGVQSKEKYEVACSDENVQKVKHYFDMNPKFKRFPKEKLIPLLSENCQLKKTDVRYIITKLKRTKYLQPKTNQPTLENFVKIIK